jgi:hypothetical protein
MTARAMFETELRHHCRRCRLKLKEPVENPRSAFCCRGCYRQFFAKRCLVCEKEMGRTAGHQKLCRSVACRREYRHIVAHQTEGKFGAKPQCTSDGGSPSANAIKKGVCGPEKTDRPWRLLAGSLSDTELHAASLPTDKATASRVDRTNRAFWREARSATLIQLPPINVIGGYRFAGAPAIDLSSSAPTTSARPVAPTAPVSDALDIPSFLARKRIEPQASIRAEAGVSE